MIESVHLKHEGASAPQNSGRPSRDRELWEVSLQFEALLLQQMMSSMRKTIPQSGLLPTGFASDMYNSMFDQLAAEAGSRRSSLGIAESIYRQMDQSRRIQAPAPASDTLSVGRPGQGGKHGED
ncbi:MAG: rod-binding protein [Mariprofundaceae bacterium]|nr:rod-binding protein [Mariprofundaceae bacterium]